METITTAIKTGFTEVATSLTGVIGDAAPIVIGVIGGVTVFIVGVKIWQRATGKI